MRRSLLIVVAAVAAVTSISTHAGRTGDQMVLQEQQNKRVAEEKHQMQEMRAMLERCNSMMDMMEKKTMEQSK